MSDIAIWDKMARKYSRAPIRNEAVYREKLASTRAYFTPQTEVFEFGCGTGSTALEHAPHVRKIVATDASANMLEIGREKAAAADIANVSFEQLSLEEFQPPAESTDMVLALNLIHLLNDPQDAVAKVYTMLKPGGVFVQSTACLADSNGAMRLVFHLLIPLLQLLGKAPHVAHLRRAQLLSDLERVGFQIAYQREPAKGEVAFIIARKPGNQAAVEYPGGSADRVSG